MAQQQKNYTGLISDFNLREYLADCPKEDHAKILNAYFEMKEREIKDFVLSACDMTPGEVSEIEDKDFLPHV